MIDILILVIAGLINLLGGIYLTYHTPKKIMNERIDLDNVTINKLIKKMIFMGNIGIVVGFGILLLSGLFYLYEKLS